MAHEIDRCSYEKQGLLVLEGLENSSSNPWGPPLTREQLPQILVAKNARSNEQDGAPVRQRSVALSGFMVDICRYNELVTGRYFMVYKPTCTKRGPHPVVIRQDLDQQSLRGRMSVGCNSPLKFAAVRHVGIPYEQSENLTHWFPNMACWTIPSSFQMMFTSKSTICCSSIAMFDYWRVTTIILLSMISVSLQYIP